MAFCEERHPLCVINICLVNTRDAAFVDHLSWHFKSICLNKISTGYETGSLEHKMVQLNKRVMNGGHIYCFRKYVPMIAWLWWKLGHMVSKTCHLWTIHLSSDVSAEFETGSSGVKTWQIEEKASEHCCCNIYFEIIMKSDFCNKYIMVSAFSKTIATMQQDFSQCDYSNTFELSSLIIWHTHRRTCSQHSKVVFAWYIDSVYTWYKHVNTACSNILIP